MTGLTLYVHVLQWHLYSWPACWMLYREMLKASPYSKGLDGHMLQKDKENQDSCRKGNVYMPVVACSTAQSNGAK